MKRWSNYYTMFIYFCLGVSQNCRARADDHTTTCSQTTAASAIRLPLSSQPPSSGPSSTLPTTTSSKTRTSFDYSASLRRILLPRSRRQKPQNSVQTLLPHIKSEFSLLPPLDSRFSQSPIIINRDNEDHKYSKEILLSCCHDLSDFCAKDVAADGNCVLRSASYLPTGVVPRESDISLMQFSTELRLCALVEMAVNKDFTI